jgi:hypothetical protein
MISVVRMLFFIMNNEKVIILGETEMDQIFIKGDKGHGVYLRNI